MTGLPGRSAADVRLADAFGAPGCPLCRERARAEAGYLASVLAESVNDVAFREALDAGRGFCGRHAGMLLEIDRGTAGSLGAAILLRATLLPRLAELEATNRARGWRRSRRAAESARPPACPACERVAAADAGHVDGVVRLADDPVWAEAEANAPFCLDHLVALAAVRPSDGWPAVEARQLDRLRRLRDLLAGFAHTSSHDRRHRQTEAQQAAVTEAAAMLAGGTGAVSRRTPPG